MNSSAKISVKEASLHCFKLKLPRSVKTIRRWCAKGDIEAQKRQTGHGEKWFIDLESLEIKIKEELEFLIFSEKPLSQPNEPVGQGAEMSGRDRTGSGASGQKRSRPDTGARSVDMSGYSQIRDLEDQVLILKGDIQWRDKLLKEQKQSNDILMDEIKGQSRYIGHLETNLLRVGGKPDLAFLEAPVPKSGRSEGDEERVEFSNPEIVSRDRPHPDHQELRTG